MNGLFVDTAGWMACADAADPFPEKARAARDAWIERRGSLVTTDYVIDESLTLIRVRLGLQAAEAWWKQVEGSSRVRFEYMDLDRMDKARGIFFRFKDKDFSFTDCASFVVMQELKLKHVLTTDHHFHQMGFQMVPEAQKRTPSG